MSNERSMKWTYPLVGRGESKTGDRTSTSPKFAYEAIGVDFSVKGGFRPFPGFTKAYTFDGLKDNSYHTVASRIIDVFPVSFRVGTNQYAYGFVYRAVRSSDSTKSDVFIDFRCAGYTPVGGETPIDAVAGDWMKSYQVSVAGIEGIDPSEPMDVVVFGRYVYVMIKSYQPILLYLMHETGEESTGTIVVNNNDVDYTGDAATGSITITDYTGLEDQTATLQDFDGGDNVFTEDDAPSTNEFNAETDNATTATNLAASINLHDDFSASVDEIDSTKVNITIATAGAAGDGTITLTGTGWSKVDFDGGGDNKDSISLEACDGDEVIVTAHDSTTDATNFKVGATAADTAANIATAIASSDDFNTSVEEETVTIVGAKKGRDGNNTIDLGGTEPITWATSTGMEDGAGPTCDMDYLFVRETDTGPGLQPEMISPTLNPDVVKYTGDTLPRSTISGMDTNAQVVVAEGIGDHWDRAAQTQADIVDLDAGGYAVAYLLENSDTGRRTSLSKIAEVKAEVMATNSTGSIEFDFTGISDFDDLEDDEIIIDDGHNSPVTFRFNTTFDSSADGTSGSGNTYDVGIGEWAPYTPAQHVAYRFNLTVNAANENNDLKITSTSSSGTVTLEHEEVGTQGNLLMTSNQLPTTGVQPPIAFTLRGMTGGTEFSPGNMYLEIVYNPEKYDKAHILRSVRVQSAGGAYSASVLQLDKIITLKDYWTTNQEGLTSGEGGLDPDWKRAVYYFELPDLSLLFKDPYVDRSIFDENMPSAGAGMEFDGILMMGDIYGETSSVSNEDRITDRFRGLGEFRWSSIRETSPELFPPENYFVPAKLANEVLTFRRSGGALLGFADNIIMHISRQSSGIISYLKVLPIHEGYGIINKRAVETVGPQTYYINNKGVKSIDAQGRLDGLHALDKIIDDWKDNYSNLSMAYDSDSSILFIVNSNGEAALLWMGVYMVSELRDLPFDLVKSGPWPSNLSDEDSDITDRAFFVQNQPDPTVLGANPDFRPCVWVVDSKREDEIEGSHANTGYNGSPRITLLHNDGDTRFTVASFSSVPANLTVSTAGGHGGVSPTLVSSSAAWVGAWVYIIGSSVESTVGAKAQIRSISGSVITLINLDSNFAPVMGDRVGLSPVYVKWSGSLLGYNDLEDPKNPTQGGMHRSRTIDSLSTYFSSVTGAPTTDTTNPEDLFYKGIIYEGDNETEVSSGIPKNLSGSVVRSIVEGEATYWVGFETHGVRGVALAPSLEVFCPDLDFKLLSVIIDGKILSSLRTERPS